MSEILNEIDEEIRQEKYKKLWQNYGKYIIAFFIFIAVCFGGVSYYNIQQKQSLKERANIFTALINNPSTSGEEFEKFALARDDNYQFLSLMRAAIYYMNNDDNNKASAIIEKIVKSGNTLPGYNDFFEIIALSLNAKGENDNAKLEEIEKKLQEIQDKNTPWSRLAGLSRVNILVKLGKEDEAKNILSDLQAASASPSGIGNDLTNADGDITSIFLQAVER